MHVDFRQVKASVSIEQVLTHYSVVTRKTNGAGLRAHCPIPSHQGKSDSFCANTEKNVFQCFSCGAKGNVLDLVQKMEGGSISTSFVQTRDSEVRCSCKCFIFNDLDMAERVGFEPTCPFGQHAFEARPLRPLRYLSARVGPRLSPELPII